MSVDDTARIDWLESRGFDLRCGFMNTDTTVSWIVLKGAINEYGHTMMSRAPTAREAIDKAMGHG